jgi:hypothetical protein
MALTGADALKPTRPGADIGNVAVHPFCWSRDHGHPLNVRLRIRLTDAPRPGEVLRGNDG